MTTMNQSDANDRIVKEAVDAFWVSERPGPAADEWVLPSGRGQIVINLDDRTAQLIGPRTQPTKVLVAKATAGISLTGIGTHAILGSNVVELVDTAVDLEPIAPRWAQDFVATGADTHDGLRRLARRLLRWDVDENIAAVEASIRQGETATTAMERVGADRRRFVAKFRFVVGTSPKQYERLNRFQAAVKALRRTDQAPIAATAIGVGYYDQAHLANDTRTLGGHLPSELRRLADDGRPNHIPANSLRPRRP